MIPGIGCDENLFTCSIHIFVSIKLRNRMSPVNCTHLIGLPAQNSRKITGLKYGPSMGPISTTVEVGFGLPHSMLCVILG